MSTASETAPEAPGHGVAHGLLTVEEAAECSPFADQQIRRLIRAKRIPAEKVGKRYFIQRDLFEQFLNSIGRAS